LIDYSITLILAIPGARSAPLEIEINRRIQNVVTHFQFAINFFTMFTNALGTVYVLPNDRTSCSLGRAGSSRRAWPRSLGLPVKRAHSPPIGPGIRRPIPGGIRGGIFLVLAGSTDLAFKGTILSQPTARS
jgi:hypothetical protein